MSNEKVSDSKHGQWNGCALGCQNGYDGAKNIQRRFFMRRVAQVFSGLALASAGLWIFAPSDTAEVDQVGYYKSPDRDRVLAYCASGEIDRAQAIAVFDAITHTPGQIVLAVIKDCTKQAPAGDPITLAPDLQSAMRAITQSQWSEWQWRLRVNSAGDRTIDP